MALMNKKEEENFKEIGRQFAYEGLNETYLKAPTPMELAQFRIGYKEVMNKVVTPPTRSDDLVVDNESRSMHR